jgi:hypothetical protein
MIYFFFGAKGDVAPTHSTPCGGVRVCASIYGGGLGAPVCGR